MMKLKLPDARIAFSRIQEPPKAEEDDDDDVDEFARLSEILSLFGGDNEEIDEEDERILNAFLLKDQDRQRTLADLIVKKIKEKDAVVASELRPVPSWINPY